MSAPTTTQVLENAADTAAKRYARLAALDAGWRKLAHVGDGNAHPKLTTTRGENATWTCTRCRKTVSAGHTCLGVNR